MVRSRLTENTYYYLITFDLQVWQSSEDALLQMVVVVLVMEAQPEREPEADLKWRCARRHASG